MNDASSFPAIAELLPHADPMILVDEVTEFDVERETVRCRTSIRADSPFVENGTVEAIVALEYMAQTIGAFAGLHAKRKGAPVLVGFLVGVREARFPVPFFRVGDSLSIRARRTWGDDDAGTFQCEVLRAGETVASASIQVFRDPSDSAEKQ